jgi:hypothetical protein
MHNKVPQSEGKRSIGENACIGGQFSDCSGWPGERSGIGGSFGEVHNISL